ncbi:uncharacterized protein LOC142235936 [Haematobia irritans]|uniref:uncharacterized protein LOC142235936 n=1 Tax=Haematobia irritans TaxID=7368 RepID=UPI003F4FD2A1
MAKVELGLKISVVGSQWPESVNNGTVANEGLIGGTSHWWKCRPEDLKCGNGDLRSQWCNSRFEDHKGRTGDRRSRNWNSGPTTSQWWKCKPKGLNDGTVATKVSVVELLVRRSHWWNSGTQSLSGGNARRSQWLNCNWWNSSPGDLSDGSLGPKISRVELEIEELSDGTVGPKVISFKLENEMGFQKISKYFLVFGLCVVAHAHVIHHRNAKELDIGVKSADNLRTPQKYIIEPVPTITKTGEDLQIPPPYDEVHFEDDDIQNEIEDVEADPRNPENGRLEINEVEPEIKDLTDLNSPDTKSDSLNQNDRKIVSKEDDRATSSETIKGILLKLKDTNEETPISSDTIPSKFQTTLSENISEIMQEEDTNQSLPINKIKDPETSKDNENANDSKSVEGNVVATTLSSNRKTGDLIDSTIKSESVAHPIGIKDSLLEEDLNIKTTADINSVSDTTKITESMPDEKVFSPITITTSAKVSQQSSTVYADSQHRNLVKDTETLNEISSIPEAKISLKFTKNDINYDLELQRDTKPVSIDPEASSDLYTNIEEKLTEIPKVSMEDKASQTDNSEVDLISSSKSLLGNENLAKNIVNQQTDTDESKKVISQDFQRTLPVNIADTANDLESEIEKDIPSKGDGELVKGNTTIKAAAAASNSRKENNIIETLVTEQREKPTPVNVEQTSGEFIPFSGSKTDSLIVNAGGKGEEGKDPEVSTPASSDDKILKTSEFKRPENTVDAVSALLADDLNPLPLKSLTTREPTSNTDLSKNDLQTNKITEAEDLNPLPLRSLSSIEPTSNKGLSTDIPQKTDATNDKDAVSPTETLSTEESLTNAGLVINQEISKEIPKVIPEIQTEISEGNTRDSLIMDEYQDPQQEIARNAANKDKEITANIPEIPPAPEKNIPTNGGNSVQVISSSPNIPQNSLELVNTLENGQKESPNLITEKISNTKSESTSELASDLTTDLQTALVEPLIPGNEEEIPKIPFGFFKSALTVSETETKDGRFEDNVPTQANKESEHVEIPTIFSEIPKPSSQDLSGTKHPEEKATQAPTSFEISQDFDNLATAEISQSIKIENSGIPKIPTILSNSPITENTIKEKSDEVNEIPQQTNNNNPKTEMPSFYGENKTDIPKTNPNILSKNPQDGKEKKFSESSMTIEEKEPNLLPLKVEYINALGGTKVSIPTGNSEISEESHGIPLYSSKSAVTEEDPLDIPMLFMESFGATNEKQDSDKDQSLSTETKESSQISTNALKKEDELQTSESSPDRLNPTPGLRTFDSKASEENQKDFSISPDNYEKPKEISLNTGNSIQTPVKVIESSDSDDQKSELSAVIPTSNDFDTKSPLQSSIDNKDDTNDEISNEFLKQYDSKLKSNLIRDSHAEKDDIENSEFSVVIPNSNDFNNKSPLRSSTDSSDTTKEKISNEFLKQNNPELNIIRDSNAENLDTQNSSVDIRESTSNEISNTFLETDNSKLEATSIRDSSSDKNDSQNPSEKPNSPPEEENISSKGVSNSHDLSNEGKIKDQSSSLDKEHTETLKETSKDQKPGSTNPENQLSEGEENRIGQLETIDLSKNPSKEDKNPSKSIFDPHYLDTDGTIKGSQPAIASEPTESSTHKASNLKDNSLDQSPNPEITDAKLDTPEINENPNEPIGGNPKQLPTLIKISSTASQNDAEKIKSFSLVSLIFGSQQPEAPASVNSGNVAVNHDEIPNDADISPSDENDNEELNVNHDPDNHAAENDILSLSPIPGDERPADDSLDDIQDVVTETNSNNDEDQLGELLTVAVDTPSLGDINPEVNESSVTILDLDPSSDHQSLPIYASHIEMDDSITSPNSIKKPVKIDQAIIKDPQPVITITEPEISSLEDVKPNDTQNNLQSHGNFSLSHSSSQDTPNIPNKISTMELVTSIVTEEPRRNSSTSDIQEIIADFPINNSAQKDEIAESPSTAIEALASDEIKPNSLMESNPSLPQESPKPLELSNIANTGSRPSVQNDEIPESPSSTVEALASDEIKPSPLTEPVLRPQEETSNPSLPQEAAKPQKLPNINAGTRPSSGTKKPKPARKPVTTSKPSRKPEKPNKSPEPNKKPSTKPQEQNPVRNPLKPTHAPTPPSITKPVRVVYIKTTTAPKPNRRTTKAPKPAPTKQGIRKPTSSPSGSLQNKNKPRPPPKTSVKPKPTTPKPTSSSWFPTFPPLGSAQVSSFLANPFNVTNPLSSSFLTNPFSNVTNPLAINLTNRNQSNFGAALLPSNWNWRPLNFTSLNIFSPQRVIETPPPKDAADDDEDDAKDPDILGRDLAFWNSLFHRSNATKQAKPTKSSTQKNSTNSGGFFKPFGNFHYKAVSIPEFFRILKSNDTSVANPDNVAIIPADTQILHLYMPLKFPFQGKFVKTNSAETTPAPQRVTRRPQQGQNQKQRVTNKVEHFRSSFQPDQLDEIKENQEKIEKPTTIILVPEKKVDPSNNKNSKASVDQKNFPDLNKVGTAIAGERQSSLLFELQVPKPFAYFFNPFLFFRPPAK